MWMHLIHVTNSWLVVNPQVLAQLLLPFLPFSMLANTTSSRMKYITHILLISFDFKFSSWIKVDQLLIHLIRTNVMGTSPLCFSRPLPKGLTTSIVNNDQLYNAIRISGIQITKKITNNFN